MSPRLPDVSEDSVFSVTLSEAAARADRFISRLDEDPVTRLGRQLSHKSVISTASSFAREQEEAAYRSEIRTFLFLDHGFCGDIFAYTGRNQVLKRAINHDDNLWNDYLMGSDVHAKFSVAENLFAPHEPPCIPKPEACISPENERWWAQNGLKFPDDRQTEQRMPIMILERILPLSKPIRDNLIEVFHGPRGKDEAKAAPGNRNCVARLYLGKRRQSERPPSWFRLKNFSLHLNQAEMIGLDIKTYATEMAIALALCHWRVHVDANDVEFVLGSCPTTQNFAPLTNEQIKALAPYTDTDPDTRYDNYRKRSTHLWTIDYDKCRTMTLNESGVSQAIHAAEENDPYFPKPHAELESDQKLWEHFKSNYLSASSRVMIADAVNEEARALPIKFIEGWEVYRKGKIERRSVDDDF
ncbi:hypothetical protein EPUS_09136 [Endocarpon pusillum Z07020]|uniref:DUF3669 domain-containing protein n=1 Tax=Endocarpon pusillum (strain Z07020 / HMAS-L-300199) TaxID=1263415 RepID=U1G9H8_ENDPU|nr:uncharacterized protein EPUS_09136 [Endocarpon pusillum Z07020]ERF68643.1 hypothetical protein EPUS_09136 [Endocarpon pusillum Z07020]